MKLTDNECGAGNEISFPYLLVLGAFHCERCPNIRLVSDKVSFGCHSTPVPETLWQET